MNLTRLAFSAERAASYAYQGHAASLRDPVENLELAQIEREEWGRFIPMYFAGRLESGNVMEYVRLEMVAREHGMREELECIREMSRVDR